MIKKLLKLYIYIKKIKAHNKVAKTYTKIKVKKY